MTTNRRDFLKVAGAAAAAAVALSGTTHAAEDKFTVGIIGPGGMGTSHLNTLAPRKDVRIAYVCDPDAKRLADAVANVKKITGTEPQAVKDMRKVFDDKAVDAVWIATPDHWHAPATILACDAGKHVYVEKPCSHNIREGRLMIEAARRSKRVVQVGTQSRTTGFVMKAIQLLKEGAIGDVLVAKAWNSQLRRSIGHAKPSDPPANLDYDLWLGPAPQRPYQSNLLHGIWRWYYDFGAGDIGNDGVHDIDVARWGLGVDIHPTTVAALGSKFFFDDDQEFPDTQYCIYEYPFDGKVMHKKQLIYEQRDWSPYVQEGYENGAAFYGTKGMLLLGHSVGFQVFGRKNEPGEKMTGSSDLKAHHQNFFDCIKSGKRPTADIEEGHLSATLCHLANIACRTNRVLTFDPKKEVISGDADAAKMVRRKYRDGHWAAPKDA